MITNDQVYASLKTIMDPELHIDIVSLGLIYEVKIKSQIPNLKTKTQNPKTLVHITMTLTTPGCPLAPVIDRMIRETLAPLGAPVELELVWDPPWTQDMMSEEARLQLGML